MKKEVPITQKHGYYSYPKPVALVTAIDTAGKPNIITVAWYTPISHDPALYGVSISLTRHSHNMIKESKEFAVNFASFDLAEKALLCGTISGSNTDKFRQSGLTAIPAIRIHSPLIKECYCHLECELYDYHLYGDHTFFVGRIVNILVNEDAFRNNILRQRQSPSFSRQQNFHNNEQKKEGSMIV